MYYVRDMKFNNVGIVDTKDGTVEYIPLSDFKKLKSKGVDIKENIVLRNEMDYNDYLKYISKVRHKLMYMSKRGEAKDFFVSYSLNDLDDYLKEKGYKIRRTDDVLDYLETSDMFAYLLEVEDSNFKKSFCVVTLDINFNLYFSIIPDAPNGCWYRWLYPSASGFCHNNFLSNQFGKKLTLPERGLYLALYYDNQKGVCFIDLKDLSKKYLVKDISELESV